MPCSEMMNLSNIPLGTSKMYFSGLSLMSFTLSFVKVF
jgi:hypothetical protein